MSVGEIGNTPEAGRPRAREVEPKKQVPRAKPEDIAKSSEKADRVEISGEARTLLSGETPVEHDEPGSLTDRVLAKLLGEMEGEGEADTERLEAVRQRLREAHYEQPEVLQETARRLIEAIFGRHY